LADLGLSVEIVGLMAQMETVSAASCGLNVSMASSRSRAFSALRRPGSHDEVVHEDRGDAISIACRSLSTRATSTGKSTPGRGIICRSNASPCRSTIPAIPAGRGHRYRAIRAVARFHGVDFAAGDLQRGFKNFSAEQSPAAFDDMSSR